MDKDKEIKRSLIDGYIIDDIAGNETKNEAVDANLTKDISLDQQA